MKNGRDMLRIIHFQNQKLQLSVLQGAIAQRKLHKSKGAYEQDAQEEEEPIYEEYLGYVNDVVKFKNISVRNLKKMDSFGQSDPFVTFKAASISGKVVIQVLPSFKRPLWVELDLQPLGKKVDQLTEDDILQLLNQEADQGLGKVLFEMEYKPNN
ncbi:MAG: hypothetical protein EZS28_037411 [Streblomastix strix]|uniref:C2 domain-containing protein n=1 Tax=Streblomastix strix TaxID=222440 RepID=A0A5J4UAX6_9EUKA|nr:MAG: hypothetical protein EZS28_037411 [Streblomastix strix]